jgi:formate dehydrogenase iron-sulfur subunit
MTRVFIANDSAALAVGAESVARKLRDEAAKRSIVVEIVRTGSRGLYWL